jgi:uncharacterized protein YndB with AHSA1/START domain/DNA-binding MarR family transcriptional regulator
MNVQRVLAAIAEPTRFRIVELLASAPRTVGEVASELGALQPQTTKHLQAMEAAGVITVHRLGRRRVASLRRETFEQLAGSLGVFVAALPETATLEAYQHAIAAEEARSTGHDEATRIIRFTREFAAPPADVWRAWTDPELLRQWWAPEHFEAVVCEIEAVAGAPIRIVFGEADGAEYLATGRVLVAVPGHEFRFELAPLDGAGQPLFTATYAVGFAGDGHTELALEIHVSSVRPEAAPAIAGLEIGFPQLLAQLDSVVRTN